MTNKPMLSVERDLLERFVSDVEAHNYGFDGLEELRALLDKPEIRSRKVGIKPLSSHYYLAECKSCGWVGSSEECNDDCLCLQSVENDFCYAETDEIGTDRLLELIQAGEFERPAAQRQGEPVALSDDVREFLQEWIDSSTGGEDEDIDYDFANQLGILLGPIYTEQPAPVAVVMPEHTMRSVMDAIQQARGFPVLTSNQCHALAEALNGVKPELDTCRTMVELFPDSAGSYYNGCALSALSDPMQCWRDGYEIAKKRAIAAGLKVKS